jgi:hypothetical protein
MELIYRYNCNGYRLVSHFGANMAETTTTSRYSFCIANILPSNRRPALLAEENGMEIAALVLFGSIALWVAGELNDNQA